MLRDAYERSGAQLTEADARSHLERTLQLLFYRHSLAYTSVRFRLLIVIILINLWYKYNAISLYSVLTQPFFYIWFHSDTTTRAVRSSCCDASRVAHWRPVSASHRLDRLPIRRPGSKDNYSRESTMICHSNRPTAERGAKFFFLFRWSLIPNSN